MRYDYIQLSKALGIVLMVLGHSGFWPCENPFVYAFQMPLFFFLSGYCFKDTNTKKPITYILKKVRGIYIPYVKWSLAFFIAS